MAAIWIVSEGSALAATLAHHLEVLGEVCLGEPERSSWKGVSPPDLIVVCGVAEAAGQSAALERALEFVRQAPAPRRLPAPVLYVAPADSVLSAESLERLVDDRPSALVAFPFDPDELAERARALVDARGRPASLRERAQRLWVTHEVERLYAGVELPALRQAVDPRNAHRPILLVGEPGTRRGLLARYVHNLAEPVRDGFAARALASFAPGELERELVAASAGRRATLYLSDLDRAAPRLQDELAELFDASGALGLEPLRWIASATRTAGMVRGLRELVWLRVELPALRSRADRAQLVDAVLSAAAARRARAIPLSSEARALLDAYAWPGNLRELSQVLDAALGAARGAEIRAEDLFGAPRARVAAVPSAPAPEAPAVEAPPVEAPVAAPRAPEPAAPPFSDADLLEETLEVNDSDALAAEVMAELAFDAEEELERVEPLPEPEPARLAPPAPEPELEPEELETLEPEPEFGVRTPLELRQLVAPLAATIRAPLRAIRTFASLVEQRPDDAEVRRELRVRVEHDLGGLEETLQRVERFVRLGPPLPRPFDLAAAFGAELDARQATARAKSLVVLRELDAQAPPVVADETQLRFAIGALLDLALRLVPPGGDLYLGSAWHGKRDERRAGHRVLLRFHSPEDVLAGPLDENDAYLEVVMARELFDRTGASFAVDASGAQDNVILVELPA